MSQSLRIVLVVSLLFFIAINCDRDNKDDGPKGDGSGESNGTHYGKVTLRSADFSALFLKTTSETNCAKSMDIYRLEGTCLSPVAFGGFALKVDLLSDIAGMPGSRILSLDEDSQSGGVIFPGSAFKFDSVGGSLVGNNQLTEVYSSKPDFKGMAVDLAYRTFTVSLKGKYVTVLIPSYPQPFSSFAEYACGISADEASQSRYQAADLLSGMSFQRGDYLFCVKDDATSACSASDYQWLDTASMSLTSMRPANVKQSKYLSQVGIACNGEQGRYSFNLKNASIYATIPSPFKLYGDYSHGEGSTEYGSADQPFGDSQYAPSGGVTPYVYYTYTNNLGNTSNGTELDINLNFTFSDSIVIEGVRTGDLISKTLPELLANIHEISLWVHDKKYAGGVEGGFSSHYAAMTASATVTLSGGKNPPKAKDSF